MAPGVQPWPRPVRANAFSRVDAALLHQAGYRLGLLGKDHCFQAPDHALFAVRATGRDLLLAWSIRTEGGLATPLYFDPATGRNTDVGFLPPR